MTTARRRQESAERGNASGGVPASHLATLLQAFQEPDSISELWQAAAQLAAPWCAFDRGVVLALADGTLAPSLLRALPDPDSDELRRRASASPLSLVPGSAESELVREAEGGRPPVAASASCLQEPLALEHFAIGVVAPQRRVLALVVVDRDGPAVDESDHETVGVFSGLLAASLERVFLRERLTELDHELRHLTVSAEAAMREALEAPVTLPVEGGGGPAFAAMYPAASSRGTEAPAGLTPREQQVAEGIIAGRSNREIAAELHLSPQTVKGAVTRVLRKLGAANRVDAVSRYLRLTESQRGD